MEWVAMDTVGSNSALGQAALFGLEAAAVERQIAELNTTLRALRREQHKWWVGGNGERDVIRVLVGMDDAGWHVLADRRWPGTRRANIDVLLVGPGGVFVVDVKAWREVRLEGNRLWRGDADADDEVRKLLDQTDAVENLLAEEGLPPHEVVPMLVLAGRRDITRDLDRIVLTGEHDLPDQLVRRGLRLPPEAVECLVDALDRGCPPMPRPAAQRSARTPARPQPDPPDPLFRLDERWTELIEAAAREPVETWMTWLHPTQALQIKRQRSGPARIRGVAGSGKTVLALHRAKYLAARGDEVLFTSYVKTLPPVYRSLFARMAPQLTDRVHFTPVHALALRILRQQPGPPVDYDPAACTNCFAEAWKSVRRESPRLGLATRNYWQEEIRHVIKGRGVTTFEQYAQLTRIGRGTPLLPAHRAAVWRLYQEYERLRTAAGVLDSEDVLLRARDVVHRGGLATRYDAVIVDEVQDMSSVGLALVRGLLRREVDGLLLVGDGQQAIYPGGFTLAEAGISVVGRSTVLDRNYRNAGRVFAYAQSVVGDDPFDDLEGDPVAGRRDVLLDRPGGRVVQAESCRREHEAMVLATHIRTLRDEGVRLGDMAVLVPTNRKVELWLRNLADERLPAMPLREYDGVRTEAVKVGTFHRAKGLEFGHVLVPDRNHLLAPRGRTESEQAYRERVELERRQLFVALTRARDGLWLGATR
jgi:hypothetical protein